MLWVATTGYAMEGALAQEIRSLGYTPVDIQTSRVTFEGDINAGARCCLWLRTAGRVRLVAGQFKATTFDELFDGVRAIPWKELVLREGKLPVTARCVSSRLASVPSVQSVVKKAIVQSFNTPLPERGAAYPVEAHIFKDTVTISIDITGDPLHKRGYRSLNGEAALRETLAASLVLFSGWQQPLQLVDPFCGSGTICIEAAMIAQRIAPGLDRHFGAEQWPQIDACIWQDAREEARAAQLPGLERRIIGSDIDEKALEYARYHARKAGVAGSIHFQNADALQLTSSRKYGHIITNPPYGKRLGEKQDAERLMEQMEPVFSKLDTWSVHIITADEQLERRLKKRAAKRRVVMNGPIICRYYQFFGPRPPRRTAPDESAATTQADS